MVGGPQGVAAPFNEWVCAAADVSVLYGMVKRAGELAAQALAGPGLRQHAGGDVAGAVAPVAGHSLPRPPAARWRIRATSRRRPAAAAAKNPLLATETAGRDPEAFAALVELAELLALPVVEPQSALCSNFPRTSLLHAGGDLAPLAADADLVILLGCRAPWYPPSAKPGEGTVLVIDEVPHRPHIAYQVLTADRYVGGEMAGTLRALTAAIRAIGINEAGVAARRQRLAEAHLTSEASRSLAEYQASASGESGAGESGAGGPVDPIAAVAALREAIGLEAVVVDETITHSRLIARHLMAETPGRYRYVQGGLGQGLGVALGVKLALGPDRLVAFTVGDGSWLYNPVLPGLMASAQYGLPVLIVVFNNGKYLSMRHNHRRVYPDSVAARTGYQLGVDLSAQPDVAAVASSAGALASPCRPSKNWGRPSTRPSPSSAAAGQPSSTSP